MRLMVKHGWRDERLMKKSTNEAYVDATPALNELMRSLRQLGFVQEHEQLHFGST